MTHTFPLGLLRYPGDIDKNIPQAVTRLRAQPWFGAFSLTIHADTDNAHFLCGFNLNVKEEDGTSRWMWRHDDMVAYEGVGDAYMAATCSSWLSAYTLQSAWRNTWRDPDSTTYLNFMVTKTGYILGVEDAGTALDNELCELEGSLASEDPDEIAYQASKDGFPTGALASILVNEKRLTSGHEKLIVASELITITNEWIQTQKDGSNGLFDHGIVPFVPPILE